MKGGFQEIGRDSGSDGNLTYTESTVAVGTQITRHPLHRSVRALLTHTAPILSKWVDLRALTDQLSLMIMSLLRIRVTRNEAPEHFSQEISAGREGHATASVSPAG